MYRDGTYRTFYGKLRFAFVLIVRKINVYCLLCLEKVNPNISLCQSCNKFECFQLSRHVYLSSFKFVYTFFKTVV